MLYSNSYHERTVRGRLRGAASAAAAATITVDMLRWIGAGTTAR